MTNDHTEYEPAELLNMSDDQRLIRELTELAADPRSVLDNNGDVRQQYVIVPEGCQLRTWDVEDWRDTPRRKQGLAHFYSRDSLTEWINAQAEEPRFYLDPQTHKLVAVLNDDVDDQPGFRDFGAELTWRPTDEWQAWKNISGSFMTAQEMAEFVELHYRTIASPDTSTIVDLVRSFKAVRRMEFRNDHDDKSGDTVLEFVQTTEAAGGAQQLNLPDEILLILSPFIGCDELEVKAKFRYRANNETGKVSFGIALLGSSHAEREAIDDDVHALEQLHDTTVLIGGPAPIVQTQNF